MPAETTQAKAARLLSGGRVEPDAAPARVFHVWGDHGLYTVVVGPHVALCTCEARTRCSHIEAAVEWENASPEMRGHFERMLSLRKRADAAKADELFDRLGS